jgi:tetratricopeptide (TPR) repeat protein
LYFPKTGFKSIALQQKEARLRTLFEKGRNLHQTGDWELARDVYQSVLNEDPAHFDAMHLLGVVYAQSAEYGLAIELFSKATEINKRDPVAYNNLGNAQTALRDWSGAVQSYDRAIKLDPRYALAYFNRGIAQEELGHIDLALASYVKATQINPNHSQAHCNYGLVLEQTGRIGEALRSFDRAIEIDPCNVEALSNRGNIFRVMGRYGESIADFDHALSVSPGFADAYWNKSLTLLFMRDWASAWDIYDWRWRRSDLDPNAFRPPLAPKRFHHATEYKTVPKVFLWSEQGVGDEVFHASMLDEAISRFGSVTVQVDGRLIPLLQRSIPRAQFVAKGSPIDPNSFDLHVAHGDLGYFFRRDATDFQAVRTKYLCADQARVNSLRSQLQADARPLVGITWRSKNTRLGRGKSINLEQLLPILSNPLFRFVNLQYGDTHDELAALHQRHGIQIVSCLSVDNFSDLDGHAALVDACDMVLTVSNTTAHIAGALGKPTFVMLSKGEGRLWYWANRHGRRSMWYPSIDVFEQAEHGVWDNVPSDILLTISEKHLAQ